jgi:hypothetical protein
MHACNRVLLWFAVSLFAANLGCHNTATITVRDLVREPTNHIGKIITVRGCYHNGPESTLLQPCTEPILEEVVWVVSHGQLENSAKWVPGYSAGSIKPERPSLEEQKLALQLSEMPDGKFAEVVLRGEFRSSLSPEFGHPPGYRFEFIVHRVLSVSPRGGA